MRRVVVTGLGVISALGADRRSFWEALVAGRSGVAPLARIDVTGLGCRLGAQVTDFDPVVHLGIATPTFYDRFALMALAAARQAAEDAGWGKDERTSERTAIVTGSSAGGLESEDSGYRAIYRDERPRVSPSLIPRIMSSAGASLISADLGSTGPTINLSTACASSSHAIAQAVSMVRSGLVDRAIAGGSEAPFSRPFLMAWDALRVMSSTVCRPFSANRDGMILGEGGAMLALEAAEVASARDAPTLAEIVGVGMSSDAGHLTRGDSRGPAAAMRMALKDATLSPADVGYLNAHGTGTPANDGTEAAAIRGVFGDCATLAISATKPAHGHALGAAGALEALATILALHHGQLPPTLNYLGPDPAFTLPLVVGQSRPAAVEHAMSTSFAFGGLNAALLFRRT